MPKEPIKAAIPDYDALPGVAQPAAGEGWYPDLPRAKFEALLGKRIVIDEVAFRASTFDETKEFALVRFRPADAAVQAEFEEQPVIVQPGEEATTAAGGVRVVSQLKATETFPAKVTVAREKTQRGYMMWVLQ